MTDFLVSPGSALHSALACLPFPLSGGVCGLLSRNALRSLLMEHVGPAVCNLPRQCHKHQCGINMKVMPPSLANTRTTMTRGDPPPPLHTHQRKANRKEWGGGGGDVRRDNFDKISGNPVFSVCLSVCLSVAGLFVCVRTCVYV